METIKNKNASPRKIYERKDSFKKMYRKREPCWSCTVVACQLVKARTGFTFRWERPKNGITSLKCSQKIEVLSRPSLYGGCCGDDLGLQKVVFIVWRRLMLHHWTSILLSFHRCENIYVSNISVEHFSPYAALWRIPYKLSAPSPPLLFAPNWLRSSQGHAM